MTNEYNEPEELFLLQDVYDYLFENDQNIGTNFLDEFPDAFINCNKNAPAIYLVGSKTLKTYKITIEECNDEV